MTTFELAQTRSATYWLCCVSPFSQRWLNTNTKKGQEMQQVDNARIKTGRNRKKKEESEFCTFWL